jgi:hypothetical protein
MPHEVPLIKQGNPSCLWEDLVNLVNISAAVAAAAPAPGYLSGPT